MQNGVDLGYPAQARPNVAFDVEKKEKRQPGSFMNAKHRSPQNKSRKQGQKGLDSIMESPRECQVHSPKTLAT